MQGTATTNTWTGYGISYSKNVRGRARTFQQTLIATIQPVYILRLFPLFALVCCNSGAYGPLRTFWIQKHAARLSVQSHFDATYSTVYLQYEYQTHRALVIKTAFDHGILVYCINESTHQFGKIGRSNPGSETDQARARTHTRSKIHIAKSMCSPINVNSPEPRQFVTMKTKI